ncbi:hypothetical protein Tco_0497702 [Tanacetum coccineum]
MSRITSYFGRLVIMDHSSHGFCKRDWDKKLSSRYGRPIIQGHRLVPDVSKPLPLGGPPGQVTIQSQFFFNKDLEYLVSGDKGRRLALSISKMKAAQYLDFGLEELVLADYKEYKISEADFKNLHLNDFEDMYLLHLQARDQTKLNLTQPDWDASDFLFKEGIPHPSPSQQAKGS